MTIGPVAGTNLLGPVRTLRTGLLIRKPLSTFTLSPAVAGLPLSPPCLRTLAETTFPTSTALASASFVAPPRLTTLSRTSSVAWLPGRGALRAGQHRMARRTLKTYFRQGPKGLECPDSTLIVWLLPVSVLRLDRVTLLDVIPARSFHQLRLLSLAAEYSRKCEPLRTFPRA